MTTLSSSGATSSSSSSLSSPTTPSSSSSAPPSESAAATAAAAQPSAAANVTPPPRVAHFSILPPDPTRARAWEQTFSTRLGEYRDAPMLARMPPLFHALANRIGVAAAVLGQYRYWPMRVGTNTAAFPGCRATEVPIVLYNVDTNIQVQFVDYSGTPATATFLWTPPLAPMPPTAEGSDSKGAAESSSEGPISVTIAAHQKIASRRREYSGRSELSAMDLVGDTDVARSLAAHAWPLNRVWTVEREPAEPGEAPRPRDCMCVRSLADPGTVYLVPIASSVSFETATEEKYEWYGPLEHSLMLCRDTSALLHVTMQRLRRAGTEREPMFRYGDRVHGLKLAILSLPAHAGPTSPEPADLERFHNRVPRRDGASGSGDSAPQALTPSAPSNKVEVAPAD